MQAPLSSSERRRLIPRVAESLDDCGYLFSCFRKNLIRTGHVGIVAIHLPQAGLPSELLPKSIALFVRMIGEKLAGRIEGGYRGGAAITFSCLSPTGSTRRSSSGRISERSGVS